MSYRVQVGGNPLGLNVMFRSPWMQDWVICQSQGAQILSNKQTPLEHTGMQSIHVLIPLFCSFQASTILSKEVYDYLYTMKVSV